MANRSRTNAQRRRAALVTTARPSEPILIDHDGPVAILTLNSPPVNILTSRMLSEIAGRVLALLNDPSVRVLVLASALPGFSGGADIRRMVEMDRDEAIAFSSQGQALSNLFERAPIPVIAAVNGWCFGGGSELVQSCDFIVASEDAVFGQPEILIGVVPGWGGSRRLTRAVGVARARRWIMTGEKIPAEEAFRHGLVDRVVPRDRLLEEAVAFGKQLAAQPSTALAAAKYAVNEASDPSRLLGLAYERELWGLMFERHDQKEGMRAFLEKRPAVFSARREVGEGPSDLPWERPGNPLEVTKDEIRRFEHGLPVVPEPSGATVPFDVLAVADTYREAGLRAFEAFFAVMRQVNDSYRFWAQLALRGPPSARPENPRERLA